MAIEVKQTYRGRKTRELPIHPGVYFRDDPLLFGLADFLVETGRAVEIKGGPQLPAEPLVADTIIDAPDDPLPFADEDTAPVVPMSKALPKGKK